MKLSCSLRSNLQCLAECELVWQTNTCYSGTNALLYHRDSELQVCVHVHVAETLWYNENLADPSGRNGLGGQSSVEQTSPDSWSMYTRSRDLKKGTHAAMHTHNFTYSKTPARSHVSQALKQYTGTRTHSKRRKYKEDGAEQHCTLSLDRFLQLSWATATDRLLSLWFFNTWFASSDYVMLHINQNKKISVKYTSTF